MSEVTNSDATIQNPMVQKFGSVTNGLYRQLSGDDSVYIDFDLVINGGATSATLTETINNQLDYLTVRITDQSGNEAVLQMNVVTYTGTVDLSGLNANEDWTLNISYRAARLELQDRNRMTDYVETLSGTKGGVTYEFTNQPEAAAVSLLVDGVAVADGATANLTAAVGEDKQIVVSIVNPNGVPVRVQAVELLSGSAYTVDAIPTTTFFVAVGEQNDQSKLTADTSAAATISQDFLVRYWDGQQTQSYTITIETVVS